MSSIVNGIVLRLIYNDVKWPAGTLRICSMFERSMTSFVNPPHRMLTVSGRVGANVKQLLLNCGLAANSQNLR